ncbi:Dimethylaniline monooxygenase N-oxide-forming 3 [Hondaea fermentalgiana]|uniref:Dimethylaniline monooxygenase N-oxide-forming 3 n=1 Tax=Hondaea fermentalgiana TaxID=2315210 RepID=A0A2R5GH88_9STRA|nr:Dimethylaniline monooxygenase N-oxide-forming 3 [Hondaea fermentalgiana]|eukprot:GBG30276.1 Dimethylaniline monooxygenase N-oxide-forming 3 [Hondaea fermentalgiana]
MDAQKVALGAAAAVSVGALASAQNAWKAAALRESALNRSLGLKAEDIVIIGCGISGICMGIKLKEAGIPFVIIEKESDIGGTWFLNRYYGAACDVPAHLYSFSFMRKMDWSVPYAPQKEIHAYLTSVVEKYDLRKHIRFNTALDHAEWAEDEKRWHMALSDGSVLEPRFMINCIGALHYANIPNVPGVESFEGDAFHTAEWRDDYDFRGKRVALIGSAASAVQVAPELARQASKLTILQRTPNWISPRTMGVLPREKYSDFQKWLFTNVPGAELLHRGSIYMLLEAYFMLGVFDKSGPAQAVAQKIIRDSMHHELRGRPDLIEKVVPKFNVGCKRICRTDEFLPTLRRDNVELIAAGLGRVEPDGVVDANGDKHEADVIVYATGFKVGSLGLARITGANGFSVTGSDIAENAVEAYLGTSINKMPNSFMLLGPNTGLGHNSIIAMIESQANYTTRMISEAIDNGIERVEVKPASVSKYYDWVWKKFEKRVWTKDCGSWYLNKDGKVFSLWPESTLTYFRMLDRAPSLLHDYDVAYKSGAQPARL